MTSHLSLLQDDKGLLMSSLWVLPFNQLQISLNRSSISLTLHQLRHKNIMAHLAKALLKSEYIVSDALLLNV